MTAFILRIALLLLLALPARAQDGFTAALPGLAGGFSDIAGSVDRLGWDDLTTLVGLPDLLTLEQRYAAGDAR